MSERKNIDRLFQEKFKEFEVAPPADAWSNIEAKLDGKKKRKIVPFWWKLSGVAAVFLLGFFISKSIYDGNNNNASTPIVNQENSDPKGKTGIKDVHLKNLKDNIIPTEPGVNQEAKQNAVVNNPESDKTDRQNTEDLNQDNSSKASKDAVATASDENKNTKVTHDKNTTQKTIYTSKSSVAERKTTQHRSLKNKSNPEKELNRVAASDNQQSEQQLAQSNSKKGEKIQNQTIEDKLSTVEKQLAQTTDAKGKNEKVNLGTADKKNINLDDLKGTINSKTASKEIEKKANDTAAISIADNELEKLLNEKESKVKTESKMNRWQLTSNVAPIFLGSASNGSPIDSTLSRNSKSYNTNVGFGVGVSYAVNRKLSIRTGLNKVNMSYNTNDISFFTGIQAKTLAGVKPTASSAMIHVESNVAPVSPTSETNLLPFESSLVHKSEGYLKQEMGYLEMPVEMTYNLIDKKFGLKVIGGFSTLFLQDNNITLVSQNRDTTLGEANNLNDLHFSTNFGVGMKYSFLKSFEFNVEPTFKYQLNTYSTNAGNFKPYYFGIYSGISYKF